MRERERAVHTNTGVVHTYGGFMGVCGCAGSFYGGPSACYNFGPLSPLPSLLLPPPPAEAAGLPPAALALNCVGGSAAVAVAKLLRCANSGGYATWALGSIHPGTPFLCCGGRGQAPPVR